jgi:hypothetical protein
MKLSAKDLESNFVSTLFLFAHDAFLEKFSHNNNMPGPDYNDFLFLFFFYE